MKKNTYTHRLDLTSPAGLPSFSCEGVGETLEEAKAHARKQWRAWLDSLGWAEKEDPNELVLKNSPKTGWQPIETAPRAKMSVLTWGARDRNVFVAYLNEDGVWVHALQHCWSLLDQPSHWMPLPPPPFRAVEDEALPEPQEVSDARARLAANPAYQTITGRSR